MAYRMWTLRIACAALAPLGLISGAASQSLLTHPGRTLEFGTQQPLSVVVKAWPDSKESGKDGNCPLYGNQPLDSTTSATDGQFKLGINKDRRTYTAVYCHSAYVPRVDRDVPNGDKDGEPVIPMPTFLYSADAKSANAAAFSLEDAVKRRVIGFLNDLAYIRKVSPERFEQAINDLGKDVTTSSDKRGSIVSNFARIVRDWSE
jgi:hypothetical protein